MKRKTMGLLLCMCMMLSVTGCGKDTVEVNSDGVENAETDAAVEEVINKEKVAVFLSGGDSEETAKTQEIFLEMLDEKGYEGIISLASGDADLQNEQIKNQILQETDVLVIEPVDAYALVETLEQAELKEIPVISYEDLIMDTPVVSYYTTYSYRTMGHMIGEKIKEAKELDKAAENQISYNIEFMMGSQDSLEALFFYNGVMEILQEYFDTGVLVCPSGRNTFDASGILRWDSDQAALKCEEILGTYYPEGTNLDIICTGFDQAAVKVAEVLTEKGYEPGSDEWPLITGIGCEEAAVEAMNQGKMYCSIYMDEKKLVETCVNMADACIKGEEPEINDSVQYDNGVKIVDANVCEAKLYTAENINKLDEPEENESTVDETVAEGISENGTEEISEEVTGEAAEDILEEATAEDAAAEEDTADEVLDEMSVEGL